MAKENVNVTAENEEGVEVFAVEKQHPVRDWCVAHGKVVAGVLCGAAGIVLGVVGTLLVGSLGDDTSKDDGDDEDDNVVDVEVTETEF